MIALAATLSVAIGYNVQSYLPWEERNDFVDQSQFKNILVTVTEQNDFAFVKYAHIGGSDSHDYKMIDGNWTKDSSEIKDKNMFIAGLHYEFGNLSSFAGIGYLDHPDDVRLSGHTQFDLGFNYTIDNFTIGIEHFSNGRRFFGGSSPNIGIDFITVGYKF